MMTNKYRFFEFKNKDFEDYVRADNLKESKEIFKDIYPKTKGTVKEVWMVEFNKEAKGFKKG